MQQPRDPYALIAKLLIEKLLKKNAVSLTMPGALLEKVRLRFAKAIPNFDDLSLLEIVRQSQMDVCATRAPVQASRNLQRKTCRSCSCTRGPKISLRRC